MINLVVVKNKFTGLWEVAKQPPGTGWLCDVVAQFPTVDAAVDYITRAVETGQCK